MANDSLRNRAQASDKCLILYYACSAPMFTTHNPKVKVKHGRNAAYIRLSPNI